MGEYAQIIFFSPKCGRVCSNYFYLHKALKGCARLHLPDAFSVSYFDSKDKKMMSQFCQIVKDCNVDRLFQNDVKLPYLLGLTNESL